MSEVKVNKITPTANCGTVTLGDSGDTFSLPAGVTLSNAGSITNSGTITNTGTISGGTITGTIDNQVNWDTTAKTAGFTAVAGNGYFVNTTSGAITVTLPATPTAGDLVGIKDYANTADTNNITIDRNGSNIQGVANNFTISVAGTSITLIYVDGTQGWVSTGAAKASDISEQAFFVTATGGTITTCGDYKIHTFTGPGTFCVYCAGNAGGSDTVDYLVVAGGGGGGGDRGGGGGAGGYRVSATTYSGPTKANCVSALTVTATAYPITIGGGGTGGQPGPGGGPITTTSGSNSIFSSITSAGGGRGGYNDSGLSPSYSGGAPGGSGGGNAHGPSGGGGTGNTPPVNPPQGNNGGDSGVSPPGNLAGGGGGGATTAGSNGTVAVLPSPGIANGGPGGSGDTNSITGSPVIRGGGGGGGGYFSPGGTGGPGGGGNGGAQPGDTPGTTGGSGTANTGGGAGGGPANNGRGGAGGSGIVVIRYKYQ